MGKKKKQSKQQTKQRTENNETTARRTRTRTTTPQTIDEETGCLMDILHLNLLHLIEARIGLQLQLETQTARARLMLAKTRMQQGRPHLTTITRLPSSSASSSFSSSFSTPCRALCRLLEQCIGWCSSFKLLRHELNQKLGFLRPINRIFGALVPYTLRLASGNWEHCVELIVQSANIQRELQSVVKAIERFNWTLHRRGCA
ncbi:hypothetical protein AWZ03_009477 [Drosophila navojoa]|uniref:Uncharacterized protein n=1 Tax=Drosophila navojoa TaxID=7232 RepID=A0A484B728_DRONA|nr:uncharacterized protein LOC108651835 [Drosophila navojoa]TDG44102.1 hypothetical protein AWZ03_009477 [Drosophila navojoa]